MTIYRYRVALDFIEAVLGSRPASADILKNWVMTKADDVLGTDKELEELAALPEDELRERLEYAKMTCFARSPEGHLMLFDYAVKGALKDAANVLKEAMGIKAARSKLVQQVFVKPRHVIFLRDGEPVSQVDEEPCLRPLMAMTAQGPRVTIAGSEQISPPLSLICELHVIGTGTNGATIWTQKKLEEILSYGAYNGIGQWRTGGYGRYEFTLEPIEDA